MSNDSMLTPKELATYNMRRCICNKCGDVEDYLELMVNRRNRLLCMRCLFRLLLDQGCGEVTMTDVTRAPTEEERQREREALDREIAERVGL